MKYLLFTLFCFSFSFSQSPQRTMKKIGNDPIIFIDSVNVDPSEMQKYDPNFISSVTVYKDKEAKDLFGDDAKDGVIYIETKTFSRNRFQNYFKSKSPEYESLLKKESNDDKIQYILNDKILYENYEGDLASINDEIFKGVQILNSEELSKNYKISDKEYGILIISNVPKNLYKGKEKFK